MITPPAWTGLHVHHALSSELNFGSHLTSRGFDVADSLVDHNAQTKFQAPVSGPGSRLQIDLDVVSTLHVCGMSGLLDHADFVETKRRI
jgi:hypothetical protein